jgi:tetratricopeptide (TPR) repeat protein
MLGAVSVSLGHAASKEGRRLTARRFFLQAHHHFLRAEVEETAEYSRQQASVNARSSLIAAQVALGDCDLALQELQAQRREYEDYPLDHGKAWNTIGEGYARRKAWGLAAECWETAIQILREVGAIHADLTLLTNPAWCYLANGDKTLAIRRLLSAATVLEKRINDGHGAKESAALFSIVFDYFRHTTGRNETPLAAAIRETAGRCDQAELSIEIDRAREWASLFGMELGRPSISKVSLETPIK